MQEDSLLLVSYKYGIYGQLILNIHENCAAHDIIYCPFLPNSFIRKNIVLRTKEQPVSKLITLLKNFILLLQNLVTSLFLAP